MSRYSCIVFGDGSGPCHISCVIVACTETCSLSSGILGGRCDVVRAGLFRFRFDTLPVPLDHPAHIAPNLHAVAAKGVDGGGMRVSRWGDVRPDRRDRSQASNEAGRELARSPRVSPMGYGHRVAHRSATMPHSPLTRQFTFSQPVSWKHAWRQLFPARQRPPLVGSYFAASRFSATRNSACATLSFCNVSAMSDRQTSMVISLGGLRLSASNFFSILSTKRMAPSRS